MDNQQCIEAQPPLSTQLARYWTAMETSDRNTLLLLYGAAPLTDEECVAMEGQAQ